MPGIWGRGQPFHTSKEILLISLLLSSGLWSLWSRKWFTIPGPLLKPEELWPLGTLEGQGLLQAQSELFFRFLLCLPCSHCKYRPGSKQHQKRTHTQNPAPNVLLEGSVSPYGTFLTNPLEKDFCRNLPLVRERRVNTQFCFLLFLKRTVHFFRANEDPDRRKKYFLSPFPPSSLHSKERLGQKFAVRVCAMKNEIKQLSIGLCHVISF